MVILETAIIFKREYLFLKQFDKYNLNEKFDKGRKDVINNIYQFAQIFSDSLEGFTIGEYKVLTVSENLMVDFEDSQLHMYCLVDNNMNFKEIKVKMRELLKQFINRYSAHDIINHSLKNLNNFEKRVIKIFEEFINAKIDRFEDIFG